MRLHRKSKTPVNWDALPENRWLRGGCLMVRRYLRHGVSSQSAALAFYLLFTIFPLVIFFSSLLGLLHIEWGGFFDIAQRFFPGDVLAYLQTYLAYVQENSSVRLLLFGLFFSLFFPMRAANSLMRSVRTAYRLGPPRTPILQLVKTALFTVMLLVTIILTLVLLTVGEWLLGYAVAHFGLPVAAAELWQRLRFPAMAVLMYFALYFLYALAQDERQPQRNFFPGVLAALMGWMVVSVCYSLYVENLADYSVLYGSLGTAIVLLIWLYLTAMMLIMGAELNGVLISLRREADAREKETH